MLVECKSSLDEPLSSALEHFRKTLNAPYAFQIAVEADPAGVDPLDYENRSIRLSAADFLSVMI